MGCGEEKKPTSLIEQPKREEYPNLDSRLWGLVTAQQPEEFAKKHLLKYREGKVQVEVELASEERVSAVRWGIETLGGVIEGSFERLIQASVPVSALLRLSKHPDIRSIRAPLEHWPGD